MFRADDEWVARVEITSEPKLAFTMHDADSMHELGFAGAPAYYLLEAPSTDDAWRVGAHEDARWIGIETDDHVFAELGRWLPVEHRSAGVALASSLPAGAYWWVRSRAEPRLTDEIVMGNEVVPRPVEVMEVLNASGVYAAIVSHQRGTPPAADQPLLAIPILNYDGTGSLTGAFLFPCTRGDGSPRTELVIVIPETGPLVLDAQRRFSETDYRRSLKAWASGLAYRAARAFAR
jgi:hypothetical protein